MGGKARLGALRKEVPIRPSELLGVAFVSPGLVWCDDGRRPCGFRADSHRGQDGAWRGMASCSQSPPETPIFPQMFYCKYVFPRRQYCPVSADASSSGLPSPTSRGSIPAATPPRAGLGRESTGRFAFSTVARHRLKLGTIHPVALFSVRGWMVVVWGQHLRASGVRDNM